MKSSETNESINEASRFAIAGDLQKAFSGLDTLIRKGEDKDKLLKQLDKLGDEMEIAIENLKKHSRKWEKIATGR